MQQIQLVERVANLGSFQCSFWHRLIDFVFMLLLTWGRKSNGEGWKEGVRTWVNWQLAIRAQSKLSLMLFLISSPAKVLVYLFRPEFRSL